MSIKKLLVVLVAFLAIGFLSSCSDDDDDGGGGGRGNLPYTTFEDGGETLYYFVFDPNAYLLEENDEYLLNTKRLANNQAVAGVSGVDLFCDDGVISACLTEDDFRHLTVNADGNYEFKFSTENGNYYGYREMKASYRKTIPSEYHDGDHFLIVVN